MIKVDLTNARIGVEDVDVGEAHKRLRDISVENNNVWVEIPNIVTDADIQKIVDTAKEIRKNFDVLFVVGVGGSFAGAFAGIQWLAGHCEARSNEAIPVEFLATTFDPAPAEDALKKWKGKKICVNLVSKSGTTLESIGLMETLKPIAKRIIETKGEKWKSEFVILDGVGGRYSAPGAVGYLPMAVAGIDIKKVHDGVRAAYKDLANPYDNEAYKYAKARLVLHEKKQVEFFASFYEGLEGLGRWWQQLFGESEGKEGKGLMPVPLTYSRDLHSMG